MRLVLPILLLTATAALAQPAHDKPFIYDGPGSNSFTPPGPVITILPPLGQEKTVTLPQSSASETKPADKAPNIELRRVMPDLQQPEPPRPAPKSVG